MTKKFQLMMCMMPNFIRLFGQTITIPVSDLTKEEALEYAEEMKKAFIKHWENKTKT